MFSEEIFNKIGARIIEQMGQGDSGGKGHKASKINVTPAQALVILGLIGGVLEVLSVLVDKDQTVQIILEGTLKRKTDLDRKVDELGAYSFNDVMNALIDRFG